MKQTKEINLEYADCQSTQSVQDQVVDSAILTVLKGEGIAAILQSHLYGAHPYNVYRIVTRDRTTPDWGRSWFRAKSQQLRLSMPASPRCLTFPLMNCRTIDERPFSTSIHL